MKLFKKILITLAIVLSIANNAYSITIDQAKKQTLDQIRTSIPRVRTFAEKLNVITEAIRYFNQNIQTKDNKSFETLNPRDRFAINFFNIILQNINSIKALAQNDLPASLDAIENLKIEIEKLNHTFTKARHIDRQDLTSFSEQINSLEPEVLGLFEKNREIIAHADRNIAIERELAQIRIEQEAEKRAQEARYQRLLAILDEQVRKIPRLNGLLRIIDQAKAANEERHANIEILNREFTRINALLQGELAEQREINRARTQEEAALRQILETIRETLR